MAVFDDMELDRKVTVYDKAPRSRRSAPTASGSTRTGDIHSPRVANAEPLRLECAHFLALVRGEGDPLAAARDGARRRPRLEQLQASLERERV